MLKNYTSGVPAGRSIMFIKDRLVAMGARGIVEEYDASKKLVAVIFALPFGENMLQIKLPAKVKECHDILRQQLTRRARPETVAKLWEQAERTAWKICADFIEVQSAMVELGQRKPLEIFLSDVYDPSTRATFFERLETSKFRMLTDGR